MALALTTREVVDTLEGHVALLDVEGNVVAVNEAWRHFAQQNGGYESGYVGTNYVEVCHQAAVTGDDDAHLTLVGVQDVLEKRRVKFQLEYPCHSPTQERWFEVQITPLEQGAVVSHIEVTARKRAEATLAASERRLRTLFNELDTALYVVDAQARVLYFNQAATALAQHFRGRGMSIGMSFSQLVPGPFRPLFDASFRRALNGTPVQHERHMFNTWFEVNYQPLTQEGNVREVCLSFKDITARKRAEGAQRQRGTAHFETLPIAAVTWNAAQLITAWNPAAERMFGYHACDVVGVKRAEFLFERAPAHAQALLAGTCADVITLTHTNLMEAGQLERTCDWVSTPLGEGTGVLAFALDASERQRLASALGASEAQFARVLRRSPLPTLIAAQEDGCVLDVNTSFLELTDYAPGDLVGHTLGDLDLLPHFAPKCAPPTGQANEHLLRTQGGLWRTVLVSTETVRYREVPCLLLSCADVTQQRRSAEDFLNAFREVMQEADWFGSAVLGKLAQHRPAELGPATTSKLTRREREVLSLMARGRANEDIAATLGISHQTVRNYVARIYDKLGVHSRAEAVIWARERGLTLT